jgi:hypothetical protein
MYSKQSGGSDKGHFPYRYLSFHAECGILWDWSVLGLETLSIICTTSSSFEYAVSGFRMSSNIVGFAGFPSVS